MKNSHLFILLFLFSLAIISCSKDDEDAEIVTNPVNTNVTYSEISGIISNNCLECHDNPTANQANISINTYQTLRVAAESRGLVGRLKSFNNQMPPRPDQPLTISQIELIEGWALGGYKQ